MHTIYDNSNFLDFLKYLYISAHSLLIHAVYWIPKIHCCYAYTIVHEYLDTSKLLEDTIQI